MDRSRAGIVEIFFSRNEFHKLNPPQNRYSIKPSNKNIPVKYSVNMSLFPAIFLIEGYNNLLKILRRFDCRPIEYNKNE